MNPLRKRGGHHKSTTSGGYFAQTFHQQHSSAHSFLAPFICAYLAAMSKLPNWWEERTYPSNGGRRYFVTPGPL
jgi:hypothetical protein